MEEELKKTDSLITDLESYLRYVNLYKQKRPKKIKKIVQKVVAEERSIVARIKKIEEIDIKYENDIKTGKFTADSNEEKSFDEKIVKKIPLHIYNFFQYFFFERGKLVSFGTRTKTIQFKLFGIKKEFSAEGIVFWRQCYADAKEHLLKQVNFVLLNGWKDLDIQAYNTVSTFNKFLNKFMKEGERLDRNNSVGQNLKIISSFIEPFLKISIDPSYKSLLKESLFEVLFTSPDYKDRVRETLKILEELTDTEKRTLGFFNIILAFSSLKYNRFVKYPDMIKHFGTTAINFDKFDFSQKTLSEISIYLDQIDIEVNEIEDELFEIKFIDENLNAETDEGNKWVQHFNNLSAYELMGKRTRNVPTDVPYDKNPFQSLFIDILRYICKMSQGYLSFYSNFLMGEISIMTPTGKPNKVSIFNSAIFRENLHTLEEIVKDYEYMKSSGEVISISYDTYSSFIHKKKVDIEKEEKMCRMITRLVDSYKDMAFKMVQVLLRHEHASGSRASELLEKYKKQNEPIEEAGGRDKLVPYAYEAIVYHRFLDNVKIIDILNEVAQFNMNIIYLFRDNEVLNRFYEKNALIERLEKYLKLKAKLQ